MKNTREIEQDDSVIDKQIGILLRAGMLISAAVVLIGGIILLLQHGRIIADHHVFAGEPAYLRIIPKILAAAFHGNDLAIIQMGLLLLIATPIARVVFSVAAFAFEHDWLYVAISGVVLAVLLYSVIGHAG